MRELAGNRGGGLAFAPGHLAQVLLCVNPSSISGRRHCISAAVLVCSGLPARVIPGANGPGQGVGVCSVRTHATRALLSCCSCHSLDGRDSCLHWPCECLSVNDNSLELSQNHRCANPRSFTHQCFYTHRAWKGGRGWSIPPLWSSRSSGPVLGW